MKIKYDHKLMKYMSLFEQVTGAQLKDCILDHNSNLVFIVQPAQISKAIGRKGANVKRLSNLLNRKIKIVEFNPNIEEFVQNLVAPLEISQVELQDKVLIISGQDTKSRGQLIGRNARALQGIKNIVQRYFDIEDVKVR